MPGSARGLTRIAQGGATLAELMRRGGHSDVTVVLRYQKATMARDIELAARMSVTAGEEIRLEKDRAESERDRAACWSSGWAFLARSSCCGRAVCAAGIGPDSHGTC
ncbi:hypothetical protein APR04_004114 [Promicromonospora umidemergens]|uniref:Phage integrase family protein n=1 Tax=Promicromonospora umidemergens TaxID=629679 RepID=A0ABP8XT50_9MICO|nr:hypothetical protein [Promicromonospora umidemergens]